MRYRYDALARKRYRTVELIEDEVPWDPMESEAVRREFQYLRVGIKETGVRQKVKAAGGRWDAARQLWKLPFEKIVELGYEPRVVDPGQSERG